MLTNNDKCATLRIVYKVYWAKANHFNYQAIIAIWHKTKTQELQLLGFLVFKVKT